MNHMINHYCSCSPPIQDNVNSLKKRFETSNMKDDEAYVIM